MSVGDAAAEGLLAEWRREGYGIWYITFIVEGFDDEYTHVLPGKYSDITAENLGKLQCAAELGVHQRHVHVKSVRHES